MDIAPLKKIQRFYSQIDRYTDQEHCMLSDLIENNKLEYVYINNWNGSYKIVCSMTISFNTENLKFIYILNYKEGLDITLDITMIEPLKLYVFII